MLYVDLFLLTLNDGAITVHLVAIFVDKLLKLDILLLKLVVDLRDLRGLARQLALELASYLPLLTILLIHLVLDIVDSRVRQVKLSALLRKNLAQLRLLQMQLIELFL